MQGWEGSGLLTFCPPAVTQAHGGRNVFGKAIVLDDQSSFPRFLSLWFHRHKPKRHRHGAVVFEVFANSGNRGPSQKASVDAGTFLNRIKSRKEFLLKPKGKSLCLTHVYIVQQYMKMSNKMLASLSTMCDNANMLAAKATPELVLRAKRAAKRSSLNVSSLVRHGVIRVCSEIERDGFLTIRAEEPCSSYTTTAPAPFKGKSRSRAPTSPAPDGKKRRAAK